MMITIGITAYNAENTIMNAINSALSQTWENYEILIVDDASTDRTVGIVKQVIKDHQEIRLIVQNINCGVGAARNRLIDEAKGEYIAFFDDDDVSDQNRLSAQYNRIIEYEKKYNTNLVICHTARLQIFPGGFEKYERTMGTAIGLAPNGNEVADRILFGKISNKNILGSCATCSQMAKISTYKKIGLFDEKLRRSEDTDFNLRLALSGGHFIGIEEPLVVQTITSGSDKNLSNEYVNSLYFLNKYRENLKVSGWYGFNKCWTDAKYYFQKGDKIKCIIKLLTLFFRSPIKLFKRFYWSVPEFRSRDTFAYRHKFELHENGKER